MNREETASKVQQLQAVLDKLFERLAHRLQGHPQHTLAKPDMKARGFHIDHLA
jgi:hypothetical protein